MSNHITWYRLRRPGEQNNLGDKENEKRNGSVHYVRLPSVQCDFCRTLFAGNDPLLVRLSEEKRRVLTGLRRQQPVDWGTFFEIVRIVKTGLSRGMTLDLYPGDRFCPGTWMVGKEPSHDFYWPYLTRFVVSTNARNVLRSANVEGIEFLPVEIAGHDVGAYFDMIVTRAIAKKRPRGCAECLRVAPRGCMEIVDQFPTVPDVLFSADHRGVIVSDKVMAVIHEYGLTNTELEPVNPPDFGNSETLEKRLVTIQSNES